MAQRTCTPDEENEIAVVPPTREKVCVVAGVAWGAAGGWEVDVDEDVDVDEEEEDCCFVVEVAG